MAKVKKNGSTLKAFDAWKPTRDDDPALRALARSIAAMFMADTPPGESREE